jgi:hypothetical protein
MFNQNIIIWRCFFSKEQIMSEQEKNNFLDSISYMPYKGKGGIQVESGQLKQAKELLKDYVGEYEWKYYPEYFLRDNQIDVSYCYGKFEVNSNNVREFLEILIKNGIVIVDVQFINYNDE